MVNYRKPWGTNKAPYTFSKYETGFPNDIGEQLLHFIKNYHLSSEEDQARVDKIINAEELTLILTDGNGIGVPFIPKWNELNQFLIPKLASKQVEVVQKNAALPANQKTNLLIEIVNELKNEVVGGEMKGVLYDDPEEDTTVAPPAIEGLTVPGAQNVKEQPETTSTSPEYRLPDPGSPEDPGITTKLLSQAEYNQMLNSLGTRKKEVADLFPFNQYKKAMAPYQSWVKKPSWSAMGTPDVPGAKFIWEFRRMCTLILKTSDPDLLKPKPTVETEVQQFQAKAAEVCCNAEDLFNFINDNPTNPIAKDALNVLSRLPLKYGYFPLPADRKTMEHVAATIALAQKYAKA